MGLTLVKNRPEYIRRSLLFPDFIKSRNDCFIIQIPRRLFT